MTATSRVIAPIVAFLFMTAPLTVGLYAAGAAGPAWADQDDTRLEPLFDALSHASSATDARPIEAEIWKIWIESDDPDVSQNMELGTYAMNTGQLRLALAHFDEVIRLDPKFAEGWNKRATVRYLMHDYVASAEDVARTLSLEPRHFGALSGLGLINLALGDEKAALAAFEQALEIDPNLIGVRARIDDLRERVRGKKI